MRTTKEQENENIFTMRLRRELFALFLLFCGLFLLLSLLSFHASDPSLNHVMSAKRSVQNMAGPLGAYVSAFCIDFLGIASYFIALGFLLSAVRRYMRKSPVNWFGWLGLLLLTLCTASFGAAVPFPLGDIAGGGFIGGELHSLAWLYIRPVGAILLWAFCLIVGAQLSFCFTWRSVFSGAYHKFSALSLPCFHFSHLLSRFGQWNTKRRLARKLAADKAAVAHAEEFAQKSAHIQEKADTVLPKPQEITEPNLEDTKSIDAVCATADNSIAEKQGKQCTGIAALFGFWDARRAAKAQAQLAKAEQTEAKGLDILPAEPETMPKEDARPQHDGAAMQSDSIHQLDETEKALEDNAPFAKDGEKDFFDRIAEELPMHQEEIDEADDYSAALTDDKRTEEKEQGEQNAVSETNAMAEEQALANTEQHPVIIEEAIKEGIELPHAWQASPVAEPSKVLAHKRIIPLPSESLLALPERNENTAMSREILENKGKILVQCLTDFGIQTELIRITPGPVVTMFELRPAAGVKVSRIANLNDDIALSLKALAVRIQAPIPGRDTVGIEIPNEKREIVNLHELLVSDAFTKASSLLTMAIGKDIAGTPTVADLARMPHLLVAGATGAGKSVCINSILMSFLYKARPDELKLLLVDPKRIELAVYADLPHLVHPVVTEMSMAKNALDWAVHEMDKRYEAMALLGVRNIAGYNAKLAEMGNDRPPQFVGLEKIPYLTIVIDELADLMLTAAKEVEISIVRLAQLARAAGIHMILATQRPSVDVVTGLIKANFPCRISFQVTSKHDSRTILDTVGAEYLLGCGDMLFKPAGGRLQRMHGAFVSDEDVVNVVRYWKKQQKPDYQVDFADWNTQNDSDDADAGFGMGGSESVANDPLYTEAMQFVYAQGKASISLIQRRFRIGFNRAARFVEQMEQDGLIGPADGSKPRTVIGQPK